MDGSAERVGRRRLQHFDFRFVGDIDENPGQLILGIELCTTSTAQTHAGIHDLRQSSLSIKGPWTGHAAVDCCHIEKEMITAPKNLANGALHLNSLAVFLRRGHLCK